MKQCNKCYKRDCTIPDKQKNDRWTGAVLRTKSKFNSKLHNTNCKLHIPLQPMKISMMEKLIETHPQAVNDLFQAMNIQIINKPEYPYFDLLYNRGGK